METLEGAKVKEVAARESLVSFCAQVSAAFFKEALSLLRCMCLSSQPREAGQAWRAEGAAHVFHAISSGGSQLGGAQVSEPIDALNTIRPSPSGQTSSQSYVSTNAPLRLRFVDIITPTKLHSALQH